MQNTTFVPTLLVPSLERDEFITIANVSEAEAKAYLNAFAVMVDNSRKVGASPSVPDNSASNLDVLGGGNLGLSASVDDGTITTLVKELSVSKIPGARGRRAVFLDVTNDIIGVGTTVVYNRNWAMHNVYDDSLVATVLDFVTKD